MSAIFDSVERGVFVLDYQHEIAKTSDRQGQVTQLKRKQLTLHFLCQDKQRKLLRPRKKSLLSIPTFWDKETRPCTPYASTL